MTGLVLLWCLAQAPAPVGVVVSSKRPGAEAIANAAAVRVHGALIREGLADALDDAATAKRVRVADARKCQGGASCLAKFALLLGPDAIVVGVDVGKIGTQLAIRLEAVWAKTGKSVLLSDVPAPVAGWGDKVAVPVAVFARQLVEKLKTLQPPPPPETPPMVTAPPPVAEKKPPADAPVGVTLTPSPVPPAPEPIATRPPAIKWVAGGAALASAGVSVGFLLAGLATRDQLLGSATQTPDGLMATNHTAATAQQLAATSNTQLTISLISALLSGLLTGVTGWLFLTE